jgi:hypothetical protein
MKQKYSYSIRYAVSSFVVLAILLVAEVVAVGSATIAPATLWTMQQMYNQTSVGRLATRLFPPGHSYLTQSYGAWVKNEDW